MWAVSDTVAHLETRQDDPGRERILVVQHDDLSALPRIALLKSAGYAVVRATTVATAVEALEKQPFDHLVLTLGLGSACGEDVLPFVESLPHRLPVIMLAKPAELDARRGLALAGRGLTLLEPVPMEVLLRALRTSQNTLCGYATHYGLTDAEAEVLSLFAEGFDDDEIGARLGIAKSTVRNHMGRILARTQVQGREELKLDVLRWLVRGDKRSRTSGTRPLAQGPSRPRGETAPRTPGGTRDDESRRRSRL